MRQSRSFLRAFGLVALSLFSITLAAGAAQAALIEFTGAPYNTWYPGPRFYSSVVDDIAFQAGAYFIPPVSGHDKPKLGYKYESRDGAVAEGIGVYGGYAQGEIDPGEELRLELSDASGQNRPVYLSSFTVNFLYWEYTNQPPSTQYFEGLSYSLNSGATWNTLYQSDYAQTYPNPFTPGELIVSFGANTLVSELRLRSSGQADHDFVLHAVTASTSSAAVPEPGTMVLMASALAIMGGLRHRRRKRPAA